MVDLLKKKIKIEDPYLLLFFYPSFHFITDLKQNIDYSDGVIYKGTITDSIVTKLNLLTSGKYILISDFADIVLEKPSKFIEVFYPVLENNKEKYDNYPLDQFIPILKQYYLLQKRIPLLKEEESSIFRLFKSLLGSKSLLQKEYFNLLESVPVNTLSSSILTFLIKVKEQSYNNCSSSYKKVIYSANLKFGGKIKQSIIEYIESDQKPEIALWSLLENLMD